MMKFADDPKPSFYRRQVRWGADLIPTVDQVNEALHSATAAVIWQIMRGDGIPAAAYQGDERSLDNSGRIAAKQKAYARRVPKEKSDDFSAST